MTKILAYTVPDSSNRKLFLCDEGGARNVIIEIDGEPTGWCVPLSLIRKIANAYPAFGFPVDWDIIESQLNQSVPNT